MPTERCQTGGRFCTRASALLPRARQVVACASSRYEYEVFTGTVTEAASQALVGSQSALLAAARALGAWRAPAAAAVHELIVRAPGGQSRTFRFGTASADLPAQVCRCSRAQGSGLCLSGQ